MSNSALVKVLNALLVPGSNGQVTRYTVRRRQRRTPFHWHLTWGGRTKYEMRRVGYNQRTHRHVYECPFCYGKAERPY